MTLSKNVPQHSTRIKLGWISYSNLLPLQYELNRTMGRDVEFVQGTPTQINKLLTEGHVAIAPCSSVCLVKNANHEIALPIGVAASGPVQSVYLGIKDDNGVYETIRKRHFMLKEVFLTASLKNGGDVRKMTESIFKLASTFESEKLAYTPGLCLTPSSAAGANLAKVLYRLWFGAESYELMVERRLSRGIGRGDYVCDMDLLIGDEALQRRPQFKYIVDLSDVWKDLTGLPFVFAVWQSIGKVLSPTTKSKILEAVDLAQARMRIEPSVYLQNIELNDINGRVVDLPAYWRLIQYRLTASHFRGLALYLSLVRFLNPSIVTNNALTNIMKWESLGTSPGL